MVDIVLYYQNSRGIRTKLQNLYNSVLAECYDIVVLTETWLSSNITDSECFDPRYSMYRCDRNRVITGKKDGGGVLIAVRQGLQVTRCYLQFTLNTTNFPTNFDYVYLKIGSGVPEIMPAARGVKRAASKSAAAPAPSAVSKNKKKRGTVQLDVPKLPTKKGRILTCGQGDVGQLGLGEGVPETTKFKHVAALGDNIVAACAGGMHTVALDSDGKVHTFGCNDEGALGRNTSSDTEEGTPGVVSLPLPAVAISAGDSHTAALLDNGDVYAWGAFRDSHGSMGMVVSGREGKPCRTPYLLRIGESAAEIASGSDHLVILTVSGAVFTLGCGEQGQLGRLSQRSASRDGRQGVGALLTPGKVTLKSAISHIWAGYHATFALDAGDKMFAWGLNNYGQLGIPGDKRKTAIFSPTQCDHFSVSDTHSTDTQWRAVAAGQHHSLALTATGEVRAVGRCEYGRLGLGDVSSDADALESLPKLANISCVSIAAGTSNSFAVTEKGEVFAWGMGSEGQLGSGKSEDSLEPLSVYDGDRLLATDVSAGGQHTMVLVYDPSKQTTSPEPEPEKVEEKNEEEETVKPSRKKRKQDDQVSTTSAAADVEITDAPVKVNGKDETPMEVDKSDAAAKSEDDKLENKLNSEENKITDDVPSKPDEPAEKEPSEKQDEKTAEKEIKDDISDQKYDEIKEQISNDVSNKETESKNDEKESKSDENDEKMIIDNDTNGKSDISETVNNKDVSDVNQKITFNNQADTLKESVVNPCENKVIS